MKKLISLITVFVILICCSCNNKAKYKVDTDWYVNSHLLVDNVLFEPSEPNTQNQTMTSSFAVFEKGKTYTRSFTLEKIGDKIIDKETILIGIFYKTGQPFNGTYSANDQYHPELFGAYVKAFRFYHFKSGSIKFTDLGNHRFKLVFNNLVGNDEESAGSKTLTGSIEGSFDEPAPDN